MVHPPFDPILDQKARARLAGSPGVSLKTDHELLKVVAREDPALSSKSQSLFTPALGALGEPGEIRHTCLARGNDSRMCRFGTNRSGISILAGTDEQKGSLGRIESRPPAWRRFRRATMPTTSVEICLGESGRAFCAKVLFEPGDSQKC